MTSDLTQAELARIATPEMLKTALSNAVYEATSLFEDLERAGRVTGNGHHMRQAVADAAVELLQERWAPA